MSSDLFAAFGVKSTIDSHQAESTKPDDSSQQIWSWNDASEHARPHKNEDPWPKTGNSSSATQTIDDDDDFGDFEDAAASQPISTEPPLPPQSVSEKQMPETNRMPFKPRPEPGTGAHAKKEGEDQSRVGQHPFAGKWDLLFEAGDEEYDAGADELGDLSTNPEAAMAYSKRIIAEQEAAQKRNPLQAQKKPTNAAPTGKSKTESPQPGPNKLRKKSGYAPPTRNAEVLFDVENVSGHDDDDDFGDFEDWNDTGPPSTAIPTTRARQEQAKMPEIDLLGLGEPSPLSSSSNHNFTHTRTFQRTDHDRGKASASTRNPIVNTVLDDDVWDDFETSAPSQNAPPITAPSEPPMARSANTDPPKASQPPLNVPPPIILLSVFPRLFTSADDALFDTMGKLDLKQRQALLAHPASHQFLKGYLGHCNALAHIIAGRKLRWKRDQRLSQSMRIGPAAAGGKGGMKLAGLDKSELAKEDREVLDVLRLWKGQIGKLRTAVTTASAAPGLPKLPPVPEIVEQMPVKALKQMEGGFTAPHACALCGLRREERVAKVDTEVEDSFGEWWVQGANVHLSCGRFWEEFEKKLKSR